MMCTHAGVVSRDECPYCNPPFTDTQRMDWMQQNYPSFFGGYSRRDLRADIDKRLALKNLRKHNP